MSHICHMSLSHNHISQKNIKESRTIILYHCYILNSKTCPKHVWLQYDIKSPWLFGLICAQNSIGGLVLYTRLNSTKSPQLFHFIWVKICDHIHLCLLPNYLIQTPQIYSDLMWSFPLYKPELLYCVSLIKHICVSYSFLLFYVFKAGDCLVIASLIID